MSIIEATKSFECEKTPKFVTRFRKLKKKYHYGFWANDYPIHWNLFQFCHLILGHSTPYGAKFLKLGHNPFQNSIRICHIVTIYKVR